MNKILTFYQRHVNEELMPFWLQRALDLKHGGIYTCFNNLGTELISTDKYTWSQGRAVWLFSRLSQHCRNQLYSGDSRFFLNVSKRTVDFLLSHVFLDNGHCAYLLSESGEKKESEPGEGYDTSFYADCFVVLGFSEYARVTGEREVLVAAFQLYERIVQRLKDGTARSEPYPIHPGYQAHAVSMIMLNTSQELADAMESLGMKGSADVRRHASDYMNDIMNRFCQDDLLLSEMIPDSSEASGTLLSRHVNPGHTLESMWFVMTEAGKTGDRSTIAKAAAASAKAFNIGWDPQFGGLLRFVDREGGKPHGTLIGDRFEALINDTWDMKIWWPHSEALYTLLLAYLKTGEQQYLSMYGQMNDYVFRTFPNPDKTIGEWIQIRDRQGTPVQKVVALPVKDPFHILRNMLLIIELLANHPATSLEVDTFMAQR